MSDLTCVRYDNRADPAAHSQTHAWLARFTAVGLRWDADEHWTVTAQTLAAIRQWSEHWQLLGEWLEVDSHFADRANDGELSTQSSGLFQLSLRYQGRF